MPGQGTPASFVARTSPSTPVHGDAMLHISAQGLYRAFVNGRRVGQDLLTPGWTCYDDRIAFQSYESRTSCGRARTVSRSGWAMAGGARR